MKNKSSPNKSFNSWKNKYKRYAKFQPWTELKRHQLWNAIWSSKIGSVNVIISDYTFDITCLLLWIFLLKKLDASWWHNFSCLPMIKGLNYSVKWTWSFIHHYTTIKQTSAQYTMYSYNWKEFLDRLIFMKFSLSNCYYSVQ